MFARRFRNFLLLATALFGTACAGDRVAEVNGTPITRQEFEQALRIEAMKHDPLLLRDAKRFAAMKDQLLDRLIQETILYQAALKVGTQLTDDELTDIYTAYKGQYTEESFQTMLQKKGIDYAAWKEFRKRRYVIDRYAEQQLPAGAKTVNAATIEQYYREHRAEFIEPESVRVRQIVTETEAEAKQLRERILKGANFAQLAMEHSLTPDGADGGDLGFIPRGTFPAVFDQVCFRLPVGAMSDVVKSEYGYHLLKILDRRPGRVIPLAEARESITIRLQQEAMAEAYQQWAEPLKQQAKLNIYRDTVAKVTVKGLLYEK